MPDLTPEEREIKEQTAHAFSELTTAYSLIEQAYGAQAAANALVLLAARFCGIAHSNLCFYTAKFSMAYNHFHDQAEARQPPRYAESNNGFVN